MKTTVNKISIKKNDMYERKCAHSSCDKIGEYKAPVSRESINEYIYFCLRKCLVLNGTIGFPLGNLLFNEHIGFAII